MTKQAKSPGEKFICLKTASRKYGTDERNILNWAKTKKITASRIGNSWYVDEKSLHLYLEKNKVVSTYSKRLDQLIMEQENAINQQEFKLFVYDSLKNLTPIGYLLIQELSLLITDTIKRSIFIELSSGHDIVLIALKYNLTIEKVRYHYRLTIKAILRKTEILENYRENLAQLKLKIRELEINNQRQENEINHLLKNQPGTQRALLDVTPEIIKILSMPLSDFILEKRTLHCFQWFNLRTVEDILRFSKTRGLKTLMCYRSFGNKSFTALKATLIENNIIDVHEQGYLYDFV